MRRSFVLISVLLGITCAPTSAMARCLSYEPKQVTLAGRLESRTVPGPPNYSSVARGDFPEKILILTLDAPICVSADPLSLTNSKGHANVTEVQLVVERTAYRRLLGRRVRVSGSLFAAHSGHHRTPVVLTVKALRAV